MIATFENSLAFASHLKATLRATSQDTTRPHLCLVRLELVQGAARFIATNGHWMWVSELPYREVAGVDEKGKPVLGSSSAVVQIPRANAVDLLKALDKSKKASTVKLELDVEKNIVRQGWKAFTFERAHEAVVFPPWTQVLPNTVVGEAQLIALDPKYIADASESFADIAPEGSCGVRFQAAGDALDPVVVTSDRSTALAVIMPRRVGKDAPDALTMLARFRAEAA